MPAGHRPGEPVTVSRLFTAAAHHPERVCLEDERGLVTFRELAADVEAIGRALRASVGPDPFAAVLCQRDLRLVAALFGVHRAGGAYLPLDHRDPDLRIRSVLERARPDVVVVSSRFARRIPDGIPRLVVDDLSFTGRPVRVDRPSVRHLAYVIFTSGSTGAPKGVAVPMAAVDAFFRALDTEVGGRPGRQVWMAVSSVAFDSSVAEILWPVASGHQICIGDNSLLGLLESPLVTGTRTGAPVTHMQCAPSVIRLLVSDPVAREAVRRLDTLLLGGEPFPVDLLPLLGDAGSGGPRLVNVYGPSETTVWVSRSDVTAARHRPVSIGEPVDGSRLHLLDERLCPVGMGELGEIFIGGRQVGAGYWRDPVLTAASFLPEPGEGVARRMYGTGDIGRRYPHGIVLLGRADDQVKVRGNRVELSDVEAALRDLPYVDDAVCLATAGGTGEVEIVAVCVTSAPERSIQRDLKTRLPAYMMPFVVVRTARLPLTSSGKIDRRRLATELGLDPPAEKEPRVWPSGPSVVVTSLRGDVALWDPSLPLPAGWRISYGPTSRDECLTWVASQAGTQNGGEP